jgi:dTDP-4-amino-4,6-dideoxygalactose transaminase
MNFIDLNTQYHILKDDINKRINQVLENGSYIMGPEIKDLETKLAQFVGSKYCVSCSNGTDALLMPLMAWDIGPGDAVFTTPFTFIATAEVVQLLGATSIFVDIDPETYNINPDLLEKAIQQVKSEGKLNPKVVIPVDLFGLCADYDKINLIAKKHNLLVLEDAAQSFGAVYNKQKSCSFGDCAATSFYPAKPLGCYGDGGAIFTDDDGLYHKLTSIRVHGQGEDKYNNVRIGLNGRLDTIQAAVLISKLSIFENEVIERNRVAARYNKNLNEVLKTPFTPENCTSVWAQYSLLAKSTNHRTEIMEHLKENGIPSVIYYPKPLHLQDAFKHLNYSVGDFPVTEDIASRIFSLPMHPYLKDEEIDTICDVIKKM